MRTLHELFVDKLKDVHDAERRITRALPKLIRAVDSQELSEGFQKHLRQTEQQIRRLDRVFSSVDESPGRKSCRGMEGILAEGEELLRRGSGSDGALDAALIAAAQEVEHYEISAYGTLKAWAEQMGHDDAARLLGETLDEEKETDERLNQLASRINQQAMRGGQSDGPERSGASEEMHMAGSRSRSSRGSGSPRGSKRSRGSESMRGSSRTTTEDWTEEEGGSPMGSPRGGTSTRRRTSSRGGSSSRGSSAHGTRSRSSGSSRGRGSSHSRRTRSSRSRSSR